MILKRFIQFDWQKEFSGINILMFFWEMFNVEFIGFSEYCHVKSEMEKIECNNHRKFVFVKVFYITLLILIYMNRAIGIGQ